MGRKSKPPVNISLSAEVKTLVTPRDNLPAMVNYLDVSFNRKNNKYLTRLFLNKATPEDIADTMKIRDVHGYQYFSVIGAMMPHLVMANKVKPSLFEYCISKNLTSEFAELMVRLVINNLLGLHASAGHLSAKTRALRIFIDFISSRWENPSEVTLDNFDKSFWLDFINHLESSSVKRSGVFYDLRAIFESYEPTSLNGWLSQVIFRDPKPEPEELVDESYSDAVMYQILALCIEGFQRRIGYLKHYEELSAKDMPEDWIYPERNNYLRATDVSQDQTRSKTFETASFRLLKEWLNDEERGYQVLIDHFIMHHKAGLIRYGGDKKRYIGGIIGSLMGLSNRKVLLDELNKFYVTTASWHGFEYPAAGRSIWGFYIKKKKPDEVNLVINQITWCLANLLMMQTGINKEVALTIPSVGEDGRSILLQQDSLFTNEDGNSNEIVLHGFKERTGNSRRKPISITIVKNSPIHLMLLDYERYFKVSSSGPFFEFNQHFAQAWGKAGGIVDFKTVYPIFDDNGVQLSSIQTKKFRKVFASAQLLDRMKGIKNGNDLAEQLRNDLHHGNLDTTLTHYLLKTSIGMGVIDTAIATITAEKLQDAMQFKGQIALSTKVPIKKTVFLCDCEDPTDPSHDVSIADECRHYDLCLGCERSVVTELHLPYICARILQYEKERISDPHVWTATFENLWCIAQDTLDQYAIKDRINGQRLVDQAWSLAREGAVSLPPIINSNRR